MGRLRSYSKLRSVSGHYRYAPRNERLCTKMKLMKNMFDSIVIYSRLKGVPFFKLCSWKRSELQCAIGKKVGNPLVTFTDYKVFSQNLFFHLILKIIALSNSHFCFNMNMVNIIVLYCFAFVFIFIFSACIYRLFGIQLFLKEQVHPTGTSNCHYSNWRQRLGNDHLSTSSSSQPVY